MGQEKNLEKYLTLKNDQQGVFALYNTKVKTYSTGLVKIKKTSFSLVKGRVGNNTKKFKSTSEELIDINKKHLREKKEKIFLHT